MSVKLGVAPIAWSNDDMPELGGDTSLEQCLKDANEAGYIRHRVWWKISKEIF